MLSFRYSNWENTEIDLTVFFLLNSSSVLGLTQIAVIIHHFLGTIHIEYNLEGKWMSNLFPF